MTRVRVIRVFHFGFREDLRAIFTIPDLQSIGLLSRSLNSMLFLKKIKMKKNATLFFSLFVFSFCAQKNFAQGNLQFNQVIVVDLAINGTSTINVPAGKVWKIEAAGNGSGNSSGIVLRNSSVVAIAIFGTSATAATSNLPFWLSSGFTGSFLNGNGAYRGALSIIEFNVVP